MKANKLYRWVVSLLSLLPMVFIGARSLYVSLNKNAYQSYSNITETITTNITNSTYDNDTLYNYKYIAPMTANSSVVPMTYLSLSANDLGISQQTRDTLNEWSIRSNNHIWFGNGTYHSLVDLDLTLDIFKNFNMISTMIPQAFGVFDITFVQNVNGTLDNAFTYSIKEFNDVGFNKIQFVTWFTDLFTTSDNIYVNFVNSYANYLLFVSATLVLPYVIYWFINFTIHVMDSFTNKSRKGY